MQRRAAALFGTVALSMPGAALVAQQRGAPPQRGSPPGQDTPYILVTAFRAPTKQLAVEGADELRDRLKSEHSAKELFVITKTSVEGTLAASGYPVDSALNVSDLMELAKTMRGEYVMDVTVKSTGGKAVRLEPRVLMKTGQQIVAQPLPPVDGKDVGDAVKLVEKSISEALKQIPSYKECIAGLRAGKFDEAAVKARAGIALYSGASWSRICLLNAYASGKTAPPDSIIAVGNAILAVDSTSMLALANVADAYKAKGNLEKAVAIYSRMAQLDPSNKSLILGVINEIGDKAPEKALPLITAELKENPGDTTMLRKKLAVEVRLNQFKNAIATGEELMKADPTVATLEFYNRMIGLAQNDSNTAKIIDVAGKAAAKFPKDASFPMLLAQSYRKLNQLPQAMTAARKATEIDPKDSRAWILSMYVANDMSQRDTVLALAKAAIAAGADKAQVQTVLLSAVIGPVAKKPTDSKERADWEAALPALQAIDEAVPFNATKFYVALASFQIGLEALQNANKLGQVTGKDAKDSKAKACTEAKLVEELWTNATIAMTSGGGGGYNKDGATSVMGVIQQYNEYIPQMKKSYCPAAK